MAFEQACQAKMHEIAETYTDPKDKTSHHRIANEHRTPYWNPFQSRYLFADGVNNGYQALGLSLIFCVQQVRVQRPNNPTWVTIDNPLYRYRYPSPENFSEAGYPVNLPLDDNDNV
jgi:predicted phage tail protein